jgi:hypothetical protein
VAAAAQPAALAVLYDDGELLSAALLEETVVRERKAATGARPARLLPACAKKEAHRARQRSRAPPARAHAQRHARLRSVRARSRSGARSGGAGARLLPFPARRAK